MDSDPRQTYQGKSTSDEQAFDQFRYWARGYLFYEGVTEVDDLAGWAWCEWAGRGRPHLGNRKITRNIAIDAIRTHWGRSGTYRAEGQANTHPFDLNTPDPHYTMNLEAMLDIQRLWDRHGRPSMGHVGDETVLFDDPRLRTRQGDHWLGYI